jgi:large subunit ribosomal protein L25
MKKGGSLEIVRHEVELECPANAIPEELIVDISTREMGDTIRMSDLQLPKGVTASITDRDFVIATLKVSSAALSEINDSANSGEEA